MSSNSVDEALGCIRSERPSLVIQDMAIRAEQPDVPVILMTAWGSIGLAVEGMKRGGADFITKPWSNARVADALGLSRAALYRRLEKYGIEV